MRIGAGVALLALACFANARQSTSATTAERVREAHERGDQAALEALASRPHPDPWWVAEDLHAQGAPAVAQAWAASAPEFVSGPLQRHLAASEAPAMSALEQIDRAVRAQARSDWRGSLEILGTIETDESVYLMVRVSSLSGNALRNLRRFAPSIEVFDRAHAQALELDWHAARAGVLLGRGLSRRRLGSIESAREDLIEAAGIFGRLGNTPPQRQALFLAGTTCGELARLGQAAELLEQALAITDESDVRGRRLALFNLGLVHQRSGHPGAALSVYEQAYGIAKDGPNKARLLLSIAEMHGQLGDPDRAIELAREGLEAMRDHESRRGEAEAQGTLGLAYERKGAYADAREHVHRALELFEEAEEERILPVALTNVALVEMHLGELDAAEEFQDRALDLARAHKDPWQEASAHFHMGRILRRASRYDEAAESDEELLRIARELHSDRLLMRAHLNASKRFLAQDLVDEALDASREAVEITNRYVSGLAPEEGARAREHRAEVFDVAQRAARRSGDAGAILWSLEVGRASSLAESLGGGEAVTEAVVPAAWTAKRRAAMDEELDCLQRVRNASFQEGADLEVERAALDEARARRREITESIQRNRRAAAGGVQLEPVTLTETQAILGGHEALVQYSFLDEQAVALVVTRTTSRVVALGSTQAIEEQCERFRAGIKDGRGARLGGVKAEPNARAKTLARVNELVLAPLELGEDVTRLIISPAGPLVSFPFAAVAPELELVYTPSSSILRFLRELELPPCSGVLAVGDPTGSELGALPGSRIEAETVGDLVLVGEAATEQAVLPELGKLPPWRAIHFACHAVIDMVEPLESALILTPTEDRDGRLTVSEVLSSRLEAELVVLAACESGEGRVYRTEGVFGFTHAFLTAGARRVLVSQWKVDDAATSAFMVKLYELWQGEEGIPLPAALRLAQEHVRAQPGWEALDYWGAWQLWGTP